MKESGSRCNRISSSVTVTGHRASARGVRHQAGLLDSICAAGFILLARAAAAAGRAENLALRILDQHGAGLRQEHTTA